MVDETIIMRGVVVSVNARYDYDPDKGEYVYDVTMPPKCIIQLDGKLGEDSTYNIEGFLQFGQKYELVMRKIPDKDTTHPLTQEIEKAQQKAARKFNDDI